MKAKKVAFMEVVRESSMSWQWMGVRYSSTSTAVAWNILRRPLTPAGIKASEMASTYINATALILHVSCIITGNAQKQVLQLVNQANRRRIKHSELASTRDVHAASTVP